MPGPLTRIRQVAAVIEAYEGAGGTPVAADAAFLPYAPKVTRDIPTFKRVPVLGSFGRRGLLAGTRSAGVGFQVATRGSGTAGTAPKWGRFLQACGLTREGLDKLTIGAIAGGPFLHGETVTQTGTGATGRVVKDTATGTVTLWVVNLYTGIFNASGVLTGADSGATATPSAYDDLAGLVYRPYSDLVERADIGAVGAGPFIYDEVVLGLTSAARGQLVRGLATGYPFLEVNPIVGHYAGSETVLGQTSGASAVTMAAGAFQHANASLALWLFSAGKRQKIKGMRGKAKLALKVGEPGMWSFDFMGVEDGEDDTGPFLAVPHETSVPPVFLDAQVRWGAHSARISSLDFDLGGNLVARTDGNESAGIASYVLTDREATVRFDPEAVKSSVVNWRSQLLAATEVALSFRLGTAAGNAFEFYAKGAAIEKRDEGEREGVDTEEISVSLNLDRFDPGDDDFALLAL